jgi:hypothetical protein
MAVKKIRINEAEDSSYNWQEQLNFLLRTVKYHCNLPEEGRYKNKFEFDFSNKNGKFNIMVKDICGVSAVWENTDDIKYYLHTYSINGMSDDTLLNGVFNPLTAVKWFYLTSILSEIFAIACENKIDYYTLNDMYKDM